MSVHPNWNGSASGQTVKLPDIHQPRGGSNNHETGGVIGTEPPPTPRKIDVSQMATSEIMEMLRSRGIMPTGFHADDKQKLQNLLHQEYLDAVAAREEYNTNAAESQFENIRMAGEKRKAQRQLTEEEVFLKKNPHIRQWVENMEQGRCDKYFSLTKTKLPGVRYVLKHLVNSCPLRILDMRHCFLNDELGLMLAAAMRTNRCIESLDLSENHLTSTSAQAIGQALQVNDVLKAINLSGNPIAQPDNCGVDALSKMIQVNQSLLHLNVTNSKMTPQHMHSIAKAMSFNHNILVLEIDHRNMKIKDSRKVADAIQRNRDLKKRQEAALRQEKLAQRQAEVEEKKQKVVEAEIAKEKQWIEKARRARMMERRAVKTQLRKEQKAREDARRAEKERLFRAQFEGAAVKAKKKGGKKKKKK